MKFCFVRSDFNEFVAPAAVAAAVTGHLLSLCLRHRHDDVVLLSIQSLVIIASRCFVIVTCHLVIVTWHLLLRLTDWLCQDWVCSLLATVTSAVCRAAEGIGFISSDLHAAVT